MRTAGTIRVGAPAPVAPELSQLASALPAGDQSTRLRALQQRSASDIEHAFLGIDLLTALDNSAHPELAPQAFQLLSICALSGDDAQKKLLSDDRLVPLITRLQNAEAVAEAAKLMCLLAYPIACWADGEERPQAVYLLKETVLMQQVVELVRSQLEEQAPTTRYILRNFAHAFQVCGGPKLLSLARAGDLVGTILLAITDIGVEVADADAPQLHFLIDALDTLLRTAGVGAYDVDANTIHGVLATLETRIVLLGGAAVLYDAPPLRQLDCEPPETEKRPAVSSLLSVLRAILKMVPANGTDPGCLTRLKLLQMLYVEGAPREEQRSRAPEQLRYQILQTISNEVQRTVADTELRSSSTLKYLPTLFKRLLDAATKQGDPKRMASMVHALFAAPANPTVADVQREALSELLVLPKSALLYEDQPPLRKLLLAHVRKTWLPYHWMMGVRWDAGTACVCRNLCMMLTTNEDWTAIEHLRPYYKRIASVVVHRLCADPSEPSDTQQKRQLTGRALYRHMLIVFREKKTCTPHLARRALRIVESSFSAPLLPALGGGDAQAAAADAAPMLATARQAQLLAMGKNLTITRIGGESQITLFALYMNVEAAKRCPNVAYLANVESVGPPPIGWAAPEGISMVGDEVRVDAGFCGPEEVERLLIFILTGALSIEGTPPRTLNEAAMGRLAALLGALPAVRLCQRALVQCCVHAEFDPEQTNAPQPGWFEPARLLEEVGQIDRLLPDNEQQRQWQRKVRRVAAAIMLTRLYVDGRYSPVDHPTDWMRENEDEIARVFLQIVLAPRDHAEGEGE